MKEILRYRNLRTLLNRCLVLTIVYFLASNDLNAGTLYVNDGSLTGDVFTTAIGNDANPGTVAAPFATLQIAIDNASSGDTIYVDAGSYISGIINVTKPLVLRGAKFGVAAGPEATPVNRFTNETVIVGSIYYGQSLDNISVDGFTVDMGSDLRGIYARGLNTVIINNIVTGTPNILTQQCGIATRANGPLRLHSYLISNNNVQNLRFGIYMDGNLELPSEVSKNYVANCATAGYVFTASDRHFINQNVSVNNNTGMNLTEGRNVVTQNTLTGNATCGIRLSATPLLIGNAIENNFFINNSVGIALTEDDPAATNNQAHFNSFVGNMFNIGSAHTNNFNATCNWYGTVDLVAIGAQITGNVTFVPILTDGTDTDLSLPGFQPAPTCIVVPVDLLSFDGRVKNYDVILNWRTSQEVNSSHFIIQKSNDNIRFTDIGRVEAKGFSDIVSSYLFTDNKPDNFDQPTFYRLKIVDRDGTTEYSRIINIVLKSSGTVVHQVYPNPASASGLLTTNIITNRSQQVTVKFINNLGQILQQRSFQIIKGMNILKMQVPKNAPAGINFLLINATDVNKQIPILIK